MIHGSPWGIQIKLILFRPKRSNSLKWAFLVLWKWTCCRSFPVCKKGKRKIIFGLDTVGAKAIFSSWVFFPASKADIKATLLFRKQHYEVILKQGVTWDRQLRSEIGNCFTCPDRAPQSPCGAARLNGWSQAVQGFWIWGQPVALPAGRGYRQGRVPAGWGVQKNWSLGQSQSCRCLGLISGLPWSELWTWSLD